MAFATGVVNAFTPAAATALFPRLVPREELPIAIAWNSIGFQTAAILGPAVGGFLYLAGAQIVYAAAAILAIFAVFVFFLIKAPPHRPDVTARSIR